MPNHITVSPRRASLLPPQPQHPHLAPAPPTLPSLLSAHIRRLVGEPELERAEEELGGLEVWEDWVAEEEWLGEGAELARGAREGEERLLAGVGVFVGGAGEGVVDDEEEKFGREGGESVGVDR